MSAHGILLYLSYFGCCSCLVIVTGCSCSESPTLSMGDSFQFDTSYEVLSSDVFDAFGPECRPDMLDDLIDRQDSEIPTDSEILKDSKTPGDIQSDPGEVSVTDVAQADAALETGPCVPDCFARECGADPVCGTDCGTCEGDLICGSQGICHDVGVLVELPGGAFVMGSDSGPAWEAPAHEVIVPRFEMGKTEVTVAEYSRCVDAGVCSPAHWDDGLCYILRGNGIAWAGILPEVARGLDYPIVCLYWQQMVTYAAWVGGRLPTEAEWEYAARSAGKDQLYPWGDEPPSCEYAVISEGGDGCGLKHAMPVCSKPAGNTEQGLCDMGGNVWEFVQDWGHNSYDGAPCDGSAWVEPEGRFRMVRGGGWGVGGWATLARNRPHECTENCGVYVERPGDDVGFRIARSLE